MVRKLLLLAASLQMLLALGLTTPAAAKDLTSKYRVYTYDQIAGEYPDYPSALKKAESLPYAHIEKIGAKEWVWNGFPRYQVYSKGTLVPGGGFTNLKAAIAKASTLDFASVRDLQGVGWVWNNYPHYQLYQGERTYPGWTFATLHAAEQAGAYWDHAHIIDLDTNQWVWDNVTPKYKAAQQKSTPKYAVFVGLQTKDNWSFGYLGDAVKLAMSMDGAIVADTQTGERIYENTQHYQTVLNDGTTRNDYSIDSALKQVKGEWHARILMDGLEIWNSFKYYDVYLNNNQHAEFSDFSHALAFASQFENAAIKTYDGQLIWSNKAHLQFWAWNGGAKPADIIEQVNQTQGLDVDSPTWYVLTNGNGTIKDTSDPDIVKWLHQQGIKIEPLVQNNFSPSMTHTLLSHAGYEDRFIHQLMVSCLALGVDGLNLDFENLRADDRQAFTDFFKKLADDAHQHHLHVSIDLPRGDPKWDQLTAFDQAELAKSADHVVMMAYDEYWSGSESPGSVSGLPWTEQGVENYLSYGIPRSKLVLGVPFYIRVWKLNSSGQLVGNHAVRIKDIPDLMKKEKTATTWDPVFQQNKITYQDGGYTYEFWMEDAATLQKRIDIAAKYDLAGISAWRLGHESADIWPKLLAKK